MSSKSSLLKCKNCAVKIKNKTILYIDYLSLDEHDVIGVIGENGAGKTTLVKVILGLINHSGKVALNLPLKEIGVSMQNNSYNGLMKVSEIIEIILNTKKNELISDKTIETFKIQSLLDKKFAHLSGGERQRLTLYLVFKQNPKLLICDEPTTGLDAQTRTGILNYLKDVYHDRSGLIISHYFNEINQLANKLLILKNGEVLYFGLVEDYINEYQDYHCFYSKKDYQSLFPSEYRFDSDGGENVYIVKKSRVAEFNNNSNIEGYFRPVDLKTAYLFHMKQLEEGRL